ncbi:MAG: HD domain-containing protein [Nitrospiraceae bacterium]|nr:HD domain-containing protein [Nitrospiraceae bacterium]
MVTRTIMDHHDVNRFRSWFNAYCGTFLAGSDEEARQNYRLKQEHTEKVLINSLRIAEGLSLGSSETALAEAVALFHDLGRFPQYRDHRTFRDSDSANHAALGAQVLLEQNVLEGLSTPDRNMIVRAVALHNVFMLPAGIDERTLLHARIVRDADKLDIWRVFIEYFGMPEHERPTAAGLGLPDAPQCSPDVLAQLERRQMVKLESLRSLNDFKLLQLSWIYDLNFPPAFVLMRERQIIARLSATLPATGQVRAALEAVEGYADGRLPHAGGSASEKEKRP